MALIKKYVNSKFIEYVDTTQYITPSGVNNQIQDIIEDPPSNTDTFINYFNKSVSILNTQFNLKFPAITTSTLINPYPSEDMLYPVNALNPDSNSNITTADNVNTTFDGTFPQMILLMTFNISDISNPAYIKGDFLISGGYSKLLNSLSNTVSESNVPIIVDNLYFKDNLKTLVTNYNKNYYKLSISLSFNQGGSTVEDITQADQDSLTFSRLSYNTKANLSFVYTRNQNTYSIYLITTSFVGYQLDPIELNMDTNFSYKNMTITFGTTTYNSSNNNYQLPFIESAQQPTDTQDLNEISYQYALPYGDGFNLFELLMGYTSKIQDGDENWSAFYDLKVASDFSSTLNNISSLIPPQLISYTSDADQRRLRRKSKFRYW